MKSDRKSQEPHDFTYMWDIKLKTINEQTRQTKIHRHRQQYGRYQRERRWVMKGKGGQIYGDKRDLSLDDKHNAIYR